MTCWTRMMTGLAAVLLMAAVAFAGPGTSPGDLIANDYSLLMSEIASDFDATATEQVETCITKIGEMRERGISEKKIAAFAAKCQGKLDKTEAACILSSNKNARKGFVKLANLDEEGLIDQITDVDGARDGAVDDIAGRADELADQLQGALAG